MNTCSFDGKLVVITGAGSGIGAALARVLSVRGAHLALVDINADGLNQTLQSLSQSTDVSLHPMDVRDREAVAELPQTVLATHGAEPDILINNAGVALEGQFSKVSEENFDWVMDINLHAPIRLTRSFLPGLLARPEAFVVNISSVFGLIGPPGQTAYSTAKFGIRGFSEALRHELVNSNVGVVQVHPGGISTSIAQNARMTSTLSEAETTKRRNAMQAMLRLPADQAAEIIARGMEKGRTRILIGNDARAIDIVQRLLPSSYWTLLKKQFGG